MLLRWSPLTVPKESDYKVLKCFKQRLEIDVIILKFRLESPYQRVTLRVFKHYGFPTAS